jgi:ketosteroid isomerase-like protein
MKKYIILFIYTLCIHVAFGQKPESRETVKADIYKTEKAFEKMVLEKGVAQAFYYFADENAVILRANDSIIKGKENIKKFYSTKPANATINWTPDFIEVSNDGMLGYTFGKYVWKLKKADGTISESKGIFHTVWKKQADGTWKYVWD